MEDMKTITLTHGDAVKLECFLLMTTNYRRNEAEAWFKLAEEKNEDGIKTIITITGTITTITDAITIITGTITMDIINPILVDALKIIIMQQNATNIKN